MLPPLSAARAPAARIPKLRPPTRSLRDPCLIGFPLATQSDCLPANPVDEPAHALSEKRAGNHIGDLRTLAGGRCVTLAIQLSQIRDSTSVRLARAEPLLRA